MGIGIKSIFLHDKFNIKTINDELALVDVRIALRSNNCQLHGPSGIVIDMERFYCA